MRTFKVSLLLGALLVLVMPAPAHAWFGWLDNLSGPGPFIGDELEIRIWCYSDKNPRVTHIQEFTAKDASGERSIRTLTGETGCPHRQLNHRVSLNLVGGFYWALNNDLAYDRSPVNRRIGIITPGVLVSVSILRRGIEFKTGVEENYFWGPEFSNFSRASFPLLADVKLLALIRDLGAHSLKVTEHSGDWVDSLAFRVGRTFFPHGFDSTDFGAKPRQFHTDEEWLWNFGLVIDFGARR